MIWHILGAGAIGQLFATRLMDAGIDIRVLLRQPQEDEYYQLHLHEGKDKRTYLLPTQSLDVNQPIHRLLVCTKAPDTQTALISIKHRLSSSADILLLQNGMGQQQKAQLACPGAHIWAGITTAGVWRSSPHELICVAPGKTEIGRLETTQFSLPPGWSNTTPTPIPADNIHISLWQKLVINCAINPLTALHGCLNGKLVRDASLLRCMTELCHEIEGVTQALGLSLFKEPLIERALAVAKSTADNRSSMLTDVLNNRTTEIDFITGYLCEQADLQGVPTPLNKQLLTQIKQLSSEKCHVTLNTE